MEPMQNSSDLAVNMPNASLMYSTFTPTFGNLMFQIMPSQTGEINESFGTIPYLSLEALLYMQQVQAPIQPTQMVSGQHTGQQNISGAYTVTGAAGNVQVSIGNASATTGSF